MEKCDTFKFLEEWVNEGLKELEKKHQLEIDGLKARLNMVTEANRCLKTMLESDMTLDEIRKLAKHQVLGEYKYR